MSEVPLHRAHAVREVFQTWNTFTWSEGTPLCPYSIAYRWDYRGTLLVRNCPPSRTTVGPLAQA